jgi:hypothetical protein
VQLIGITLGLAWPAQAGANDAGAALARMRQAAGIDLRQGQTGEFVILGKANRYESAGDFSLRFTPAGKFLHQVAGPLAETVGFDGKDCWAMDMTGCPRAIELYERDYFQLQIGLQTGQWLADAAAADVAVAAAGADQGAIVLEVKHGRLKGRLRVDRSTWLPVVLERTGVTGAETWTFSDFRDDLGWKLPGRMTIKREGSEVDAYEVRSAKRVQSGSDSAGHFEPITARPLDTHFDRAASPALEVKRAPTGHFLVHPRIDGVDVGWFIFDTGAGSSSVVDPSAAGRLKLSRLGARSITSMMGTVRAEILRGEKLEIGPMTLEKPFLVQMDLTFVRKVMGQEVVGIIGYDLLSRCVAEITVTEQSIKLHDPDRYRLEPSRWQELVLNQAIPTVEAAFEGDRRGLFRIDVGAAGAAGGVLFHAPAVERLQLARDRKLTNAKVGPARIGLGKIAWFELADHRFENPTVIFALDRQGPFGDEYVEGNIGMEFLKPFRLVLDYPHKRLAFIGLAPGAR